MTEQRGDSIKWKYTNNYSTAKVWNTSNKNVLNTSKKNKWKLTEFFKREDC